ncbi:regulator of G-protein signaling 16-like [Hypomesus transpacificus]|uniref:regulator of G-protein signaling 16-like n=1 Tax=Hypomesus transpacificus TaxID=137520 RepID=UPI001F0794F9|nr:regulator of G-protein signaling 16-like [Hypomesus transpacificus]
MCKGLECLSVTCLERAKVLKSLFGNFLHRPDLSIMGHSHKSEKTRLNMDEPTKWRESFDNLLSSQHGQCSFRAFLVSEFSEENLAFYLACEEYRDTKESKLSVKAKKIYDKFICCDAPKEVNLDYETRSITKTNLEHPTLSCFDLAQEKIYTLMEKDCYPRYLKSPNYLELTRQVRAG